MERPALGFLLVLACPLVVSCVGEIDGVHEDPGSEEDDPAGDDPSGRPPANPSGGGDDPVDDPGGGGGGCGDPGPGGGGSFANLPLVNVVPGRGHIGLDIWWNDYNPCHHSDDPNYGACVMSNVGSISYYKVLHFDNSNPSAPNDFPLGVFIDNQNQNSCTDAAWCTGVPCEMLHHGWADLVSGAALEVYGYDGLGGARVDVGSSWSAANGGIYSEAVGTITLPAPGDPLLNGFVSRDGAPVTTDEAGLDFFQTGVYTATTSTGLPMGGFASTSTKADGYYSSGPVFRGKYKIYVGDRVNQKKIIVYLDIQSAGERVDFDLAKPCFGRAPCEVVPF